MDKQQFYFVFATQDEAHEALPKFDSAKAVTLRADAADARRREEESFQRSDTDGFLSQWASSITAQEKDREATLADNGGLVIRPVLVDIVSGEVVAACVHQNKSLHHYGTDYTWKVYRPTGKYNGVDYVGDAKRKSTFTKKGLRKAWVMAPGKMYSRSPGNHLPEQRGLGGCASYSGKHADIDYNASGLPL